MWLFVALLSLATVASGAWCAGQAVALDAKTTGRSRIAWALALATVVTVAAWLRFCAVPGHHAVYIDEPWYAEAACNLARLGHLAVCEETWSGRRCAPYGKAWGWPVLISPWTMLFGCDSAIGIQINRVLGTVTVILAAFATRSAGGGWLASTIAAALLALHPVHVAWSATAETNVPAAAAFLAGLCGALVYLRTGRSSGAALAISGLGLSVTIRPECLVAAAATASLIGLRARSRQRWLVASAAAIVCIVAGLAGLRLWVMNEAISGGAFLAAGNVSRNLLVIYRQRSVVVHAMVVLLATGGAVRCWRSHHRDIAWLLLCAGISGALPPLAYDRFHERMLLGATVSLLPLCGFAVAWRVSSGGTAQRGAAIRLLTGGSLVLMVALLWKAALLSTTVPPETQVLETRIASRLTRLPFAADALFICEQPPVVGAAGMRHVMTTTLAVQDAGQLEQVISSGRPVYFLCDMYCEPEFAGVLSAPACRQMLERFALEPVVEESLNGRNYALYRVSGPAVAGVTPPGCPALSRTHLD